MSITVSTDKGDIKGIQKTDYREFLGIPFAKPPKGLLRFCAPQPCDPWNDVLDTTQFGPSAPQLEGLAMTPTGPSDEDCLYLNVYTPATDNQKRPVMFWIHGGAFIGGAGSSPMYYGGPLLARHDVVLVTINYRVGVLGYMDLSSVGGAYRGAVANCGQLDQIAALKWVEANIANFGGNPDDVTIFGQSAGAMSAAILLAMPEAKGLFKKAICQSGGANDVISKAEADEYAGIFMKTADVDNLGALWDIPAKKMVELHVAAMKRPIVDLPGQYVPVYDTPSIPLRPIDAIADGAASGISLIAGYNRDEDKSFHRMLMPNPDPIDDETLIKRAVNEIYHTYRDREKDDNTSQTMTEKMIAVYRTSRRKLGLPSDNLDILEAIGGDAKFRIPGVMLLEAQARHQSNVFAYLFAWESPGRRGALGACHALDLPFMFGTYEAPEQDKFAGTGPAVVKLSQQMMDAWVAFARTGNPSHAGIGEWVPYEAKHRQTMIFGAETQLASAPFDEERSVWTELLGA